MPSFVHFMKCTQLLMTNDLQKLLDLPAETLSKRHTIVMPDTTP